MACTGLGRPPHPLCETLYPCPLGTLFTVRGGGGDEGMGDGGVQKHVTFHQCGGSADAQCTAWGRPGPLQAPALCLSPLSLHFLICKMVLVPLKFIEG